MADQNSSVLELRLGSGPDGIITFRDFELPESIGEFGGEQMHSVKQFVGGKRQIQTFGPIPNTLSWSGVFLGKNAFARARSIDRLRIDPTPQVVTYGPWRFKGIVTKFTFRPNHQFHVPYTIEIVPSQDLTQQTSSTAVDTGIPEAQFNRGCATISKRITDILNSAVPALPGSLLNDVQAAIGQFQTDLRFAGGQFGGMTTTTYNADILGLQDAANQLAAFSGVSGGVAQASDLDGVSAAQDLWYMLLVVIRIAKPEPVDPTIIHVVNPNLFTLAAQYLDDASAYDVIMKANNLYDPQPLGTYELIIPRD